MLGAGAGKEIVIGMRSRETGEVTATIIPDRSEAEMLGSILSHIQPGTRVFTDAHKSYRGLDNHEDVTHNRGEYRDGEIHTNSIERFWAIMKRGFKGSYHHMSPKHLQRYVNEFAGRYNIRNFDTIEKNEVARSRYVRKDHQAERNHRRKTSILINCSEETYCMSKKEDGWPFDHIDATPEELARAMFKKPNGSHRESQSEKDRSKKIVRLFRRLFRSE